jgi:hypothetical protein
VKIASVQRSLGMAMFALLAGCQLVAGLHDRDTDPPPGPGCALPGRSAGTGQIRLVNVGTSATNSVPSQADFCVRTSGTTDWGRPVFLDGGLDYGDAGKGAASLCTTGLGYSQSTVPFYVMSGKIDVKAIQAGLTCDAAATSEQDGVAVGDSVAAGGTSPVITFVRYGGGESSPEELAALAEEPSGKMVDNISNHIRVVNALNGGNAASVQFGSANGTALPTTLASTFFAQALLPGTVAPVETTSIGPVDAEGYLEVIPGMVSYGFALGSDSAQNAIAVAASPSVADTQTYYVIGDSANKQNTFPVRALLCEDYTNEAGNLNAMGGGKASSEESLLASCVPSAFPEISVDSWDVALYGANAPFETQRAQAIPAAVAARLSDLICLSEVDSKADRVQIIGAAAAAGTFPYSYDVDTTVDTPANDPRNLSGKYPPPIVNPPCSTAAGIDETKVAAAYACAQKNCGNSAGELAGSTNCLEEYCINEFLPFFHLDGTTPTEIAENICFDCMVENVDDPTETLAAGQTTCTTSAKPAFNYQGQTPLLILSKYKIVPGSQKLYAYPSTGLRRGILKAQIALPGPLTVDFFCTQLVSPQIDKTIPYIGWYGTDSVTENGWADEQLFQAQRAVSWIQGEQQHDKVPAIIAGTFYSTLPYTNPTDAMKSLEVLSPDVMNALEATTAFTRAEPPTYVRLCDTCGANPYTPGSPDLEFSPLFLYGFPKSSTAGESLWATDFSLTITPQPGQTQPPNSLGPLSVYYGHNTLLVRPPSQ